MSVSDGDAASTRQFNVSLYVSPPEREYQSLCVKQPIGKRLFKLFCQTRPDLQNHISLLDALVQHVKLTENNK